MDEKSNMCIIHVITPDGKIIPLDEEPGSFEFKPPMEKEERSWSKTITVECKFKIDKRTKERVKWLFNGCRTRKEYRRFKKTKKRLQRELEIINKTKGQKTRGKKSLEWLKKFLKKQKIQDPRIKFIHQ